MSRSLTLGIFAGSAVLVLSLMASVDAQVRPGGPGPGGPGPGGPRPIPNPGPQPVQPFNPNPQPVRPGNPQPGQPNYPGGPNYSGAPMPGQPGGAPQGPQPGGWSVHNPFAPASRQVVPGGPVPVGPVPVPRANVGPEWQQANAYIQSGNYTAAQQVIDAQMKRDPSLNGMMSTVSALEQARAPTPAMQAVRTQALQLAQTQINQGVNQPLPYVAVAKFSLEDRNDQQFRQATQVLIERYPNNEYAHYFNGIRQMQDGDYQQAEQSLRRARAMGMPEESVAHLLKIAIDNQRWVWQYAYATLYVVVAWLAGLAFLFLTGKTLSALTLRSLEYTGADAASAFDLWLRRAYRVVVNLAGLYYYLSLPVVVLLAIALPLSLGYALLMVPVLNLGLVLLVLILGFGGVLTALSGLRTAFARVQEREVGRAVTPEESPRLWEVAREVAERVGTRCVDEIRITPSTDVAVVERGSFLQRLRDRGRRVLILGLGAAQGMKLDALKCILAHEYGHFQNRDTAGGDIALRVYRAMQNFANAIVRRGKIRWWDVAVHFLRVYHYLFRRLTFGASRLQEVLADRVAVRSYGRPAFQEGLTHVIRRSVEFDLAVSRAVRETLRNTRPSLAFYSPDTLLELSEREHIEGAVRTILGRPTDQDDSHPSPKDRFALAARIDTEDRPLDPETAWALLTENERLLNDMSKLVDHLVDIEAEQVQAVQSRAIHILSSILSRRPHPDVYAERARIHHQRGDHDRALTDMNEALRFRPNAAALLCGRALIHKARNQHADAVEDLRRAEQQFQVQTLSREDRFSLYALLGQCLARIGRHEEAVRAFTTALEARPDSLSGLVERGRSFLELHATGPAMKDFSAVVEHWPTSPEGYWERARAYEALGDGEQAERDRARAKVLDPRLTAADAYFEDVRV